MTHVEKFGASTDAGNVSQELPTLHPIFAIPAADGNHTLAFAVGANAPEAQPPTLRAAKILALTALDLFTDPALLSEVTREFHEWKSAYHNGEHLELVKEYSRGTYRTIAKFVQT
ncbi:hypothetical protein HPB48_022293 [Haemaphysalis longicornis]|uniref:Uncharacterized protein n=1 Tax=Haemaphysalis longicornis TaxID=44386 RepID=A0A9J6FYT7_HAELO|nr:hypothetical protein HPB48_022293 [Haemaphysalis longicornis]